MASHTYNSSTRKAEAGRSFNSSLAFFTQQEQGQPESYSEKLYDLKFKKKKKKKQEYVLSLKQSGAVFYQGALTHKTGGKSITNKSYQQY